MKLNKSDITFSMIIITVFICLLFLPKAINSIPSKELKFKIAVILVILIFITSIVQCCYGLVKRQFTTTKYIILADIIEIIAFLILSFLTLKNYDATDIEVLLKRNDNIITAILFFIGAILVKNFLKNERFKKKS